MTREAASNRIAGCLKRMGLPPSRKANGIICEAVLAYRDNRGQMNGAWMSQLLPTTAAACGVTVNCAEVTVSRALSALWEKHGRKVRSVLRLPEDADKPSCRDFILLLSETAFPFVEEGA